MDPNPRSPVAGRGQAARNQIFAEAREDGIPRGEIDFATGLVRLDGARWLAVEENVPAQAIARSRK
jgi:hypothetical protein